jgi:hypothetical protein
MGGQVYGLSSWLERAWEGVLYPRNLPAGDNLSHYATQFDRVEAGTIRDLARRLELLPRLESG